MQAERAILEKDENKEYLPIEGLMSFRAATAELLLGPDHPAIKEVVYAVIQSFAKGISSG